MSLDKPLHHLLSWIVLIWLKLCWLGRVASTQAKKVLTMYQKTMFDRYYSIKTVCHLKTLEKTLQKVQFCITIIARKTWRISRLWKCLFENIDLRHNFVTKLRSFLCTLLLMTSILWRHRVRISKVQKPCTNSTLIAWLIHGFLPVETWLLIACDTAFYAIIIVKEMCWKCS